MCVEAAPWELPHGTWRQARRWGFDAEVAPAPGRLALFLLRTLGITLLSGGVSRDATSGIASSFRTALLPLLITLRRIGSLIALILVALLIVPATPLVALIRIVLSVAHVRSSVGAHAITRDARRERSPQYEGRRPSTDGGTPSRVSVNMGEARPTPRSSCDSGKAPCDSRRTGQPCEVNPPQQYDLRRRPRRAPCR